MENFMHVEVVEMDSNGRIYLPVSIRRRLKARRFRAFLQGDRLVLVPIDLEELYGAFAPALYQTAEEIDRAVEEESAKAVGGDIH